MVKFMFFLIQLQMPFCWNESPGTVPFYFQADIYKVVLQFLYVYFGTWREGGGGVDVGGEVLPTYLQFSRRKT